MSSLHDKLSVWNLVLDHLVEKPLLNLTTENTYQRWLERNMDSKRDGFLRTHPWNFAVEFFVITADATAPAFKWDYRYAVPEDALRVLPITYLGQRGGNPIPFERQGDWILTDQATTLYVPCIMRRDDYSEWDNLAVEAFALAVAAQMAHRFTAKANLRAGLVEDAQTAFRTAMEIDTGEGDADPVEQHTVLDVRSI